MDIKTKDLINKAIRDYKLLGQTDETAKALEWVRDYDERPIYRIMMMSKSGGDPIIYGSGKNSGFPDTGNTADMGYYYDIDDAIKAMHENWADIRECCYDYGFVLIQKPGLYQECSKENRIYFKWNEEKQGFFEADEPELLGILAF